MREKFWKKYSKKTAHFHEAVGDHLSIFSKTHARYFAEIFDEVFSEVLEDK